MPKPKVKATKVKGLKIVLPPGASPAALEAARGLGQARIQKKRAAKQARELAGLRNRVEAVQAAKIRGIEQRKKLETPAARARIREETLFAHLKGRPMEFELAVGNGTRTYVFRQDLIRHNCVTVEVKGTNKPIWDEVLRNKLIKAVIEKLK